MKYEKNHFRQVKRFLKANKVSWKIIEIRPDNIFKVLDKNLQYICNFQGSLKNKFLIKKIWEVKDDSQRIS